jgi:hypothetical protein
LNIITCIFLLEKAETHYTFVGVVAVGNHNGIGITGSLK